MMNGMAKYDNADDPHGQDSDKLESDSDDCQEVIALSVRGCLVRGTKD
jgi:hypothetical protein